MCACVCVRVCVSWGPCLGLARIINICRVGQNRIYTPYMTVYLVISLKKYPYIYGSGQPYTYSVHSVCLAGISPDIRAYAVLANPKYTVYMQYYWQGFHQIYGHLVTA